MEQVKRSKRYLNRMEKIYSGIFSSSGHNEEDYDDDVISFLSIAIILEIGLFILILLISEQVMWIY